MSEISRLKQKLILLSKALLASVSLRAPNLRTSKKRSGVIVSLTSFPARIETTWQTIESIMRQDVAPEKIVLVLADPEFENRKVPKSISKRSVEIIWVENNTRSYKKLLPVRRKYKNEIIVTVDDDIIYPRWWLAALLQEHDQQPDSIIGMRGAEMTFKDGALAPYSSWPGATRGTPSHLTFLKGDGGILYPPASLPDIALDETLAMQLCPHADDVWFKITSLLARTKVNRIENGPFDLPTILSSQRISLRNHNVTQNGNDIQINQCLKYFSLHNVLGV